MLLSIHRPVSGFSILPLRKLQDLNLFNTKVTDAGLEHLKALTSLQWLSLGSSFGPIGKTKVTNAGLEHLKGLPDLWYLELWGTQVSEEGVKRLHEALPKCRISSPHGELKALVTLYREQIPGTYYWRLIPPRSAKSSGSTAFHN
jgi:hypothetical protein